MTASVHRLLLAAVSAASVLAAVGASAQAERDATPEETRMVVERLNALGYARVVDVDVVYGRFEADARSPAGRDVDVLIDMRTLEILSERPS